MVGYAKTTKGYRVFDCEKEKITTSRDVIIIESQTSKTTTMSNHLLEPEPTKEEEQSLSVVDGQSIVTVMILLKITQ